MEAPLGVWPNDNSIDINFKSLNKTSQISQQVPTENDKSLNNKTLRPRWGVWLVDCPTQLICTWILICSMTKLKKTQQGNLLGQICPHTAHTRLPLKIKWAEILFVNS